MHDGRLVRTHAPSAGDLILQMDIEGAEWPVILNASQEVLTRFRIIVLEPRFGFAGVLVPLG
jgi:hypothetical protein